MLAHKEVSLLAIALGMDLSGADDIGSKAKVAVFGQLAELEKEMILDRKTVGGAWARTNEKQVCGASHGKIITICNSKGGVGKTTLTVNLAHALANRKKSVLVVDMDSQCNATSLLLPYGASRFSLYELLDDPTKSIDSMVYPTEYERVKILPNVEETSALEAELLAQGLAHACSILRSRLRDYARERFDYIIVDTPPNMGLFVVSALYCSDLAIVPVLSRRSFSLEGLSKAIMLIDGIRAQHNPDLKLLRLLVNAVDMRTSMSRAGSSILAARFGREQLFKSTIPISSAFEKAEHLQKTVIRDAPYSPCAKAFRKLARELDNILSPKGSQMRR